MNSPLVSVVICTYNGELFLNEQLTSLEQQDYPNLQFICSDNNSSDNTATILKDWCSKAGNRIFTSIKVKGLNKNFFHAIKFAGGDYIIFCDQDDIWLPCKITRLVTFHENNLDASMVYCLSQPFTGTIPKAVTGNTKGIIRLEGTEIKRSLLISFTLGHNMLISQKVLRSIPHPTGETIAYDWWITLSAMCLGPIRCLQEHLTLWRQHPGNVTKVLNEDLFFISRIEYLNAFLGNLLINAPNRSWITEARKQFITLSNKRFSYSLFLFLLKNARHIFFYKRKVTKMSEWISYIKWSFRMSRRTYRP
ncbi:MAG: glycosyltransferase [Ferruginibacter sp.]